MDISLHSFIILIGLIVMAFILWDGFKKVRAKRASKLRIKLDDQFDDLSEDRHEYGNEFPNGGARTVLDTSDTGLDELEFNEAAVDEQLLNKVAEELNQMDLKASKAVKPKSKGAKKKVVSQKTQQKPASKVPTKKAEANRLESPLEAKSKAEVSANPFLTTKASSFKKNTERASEPVVPKSSTKATITANQPSSAESIKAGPDDKIESTSQDEPLVFFRKSYKTKKVKTASEESENKRIASERAQRWHDDVQAMKKTNHEVEEPVKPRASEHSVAESKAIPYDKPVPMLMESLELGNAIEPSSPKQVEMPLSQQPVEDTKPISPKSVPKTSDSHYEPFGALDDIDPLLDDVPETFLDKKAPVGERLSERPPAQEVVVINVMKSDEDPLLGNDLYRIFEACDFRHGEMGIYHRFEEMNAQGKIQFSVANGVEPGTFDPATLDTIKTSGISFFMSLPGPDRPMEAFDAMLEVAHVFARNFSAELHDESHSDLTPQTIEHFRQRIREFSRKQKMLGAKA